MYWPLTRRISKNLRVNLLPQNRGTSVAALILSIALTSRQLVLIYQHGPYLFWFYALTYEEDRQSCNAIAQLLLISLYCDEVTSPVSLYL